jgi:N-acetylglutamate synthase-like GNAT family acetyltransferase
MPAVVTAVSPYSVTNSQKTGDTVMQTFHIRRAQLSDVPALKQLIIEAAHQLNSADYTPAQIHSVLQYVYGVDSQLILDGTYYVVEVNGRIAGCGGWSKRNTMYGGDQAKSGLGDDMQLDPHSDAAKIRAFFVHPQFARQGIGRVLMAASEAAARQAGFTKLELVATLTGEPLYAAAGFEVRERYDAALPDGSMFPVARMEKTAVSAHATLA